MMGWVGSFYDQMSTAAFWTLDAAIGFAGALAAFVVRKPLARTLDPDRYATSPKWQVAS